MNQNQEEVPVEQMTLMECPPGLFKFGDGYGLKTEYNAIRAKKPVNPQSVEWEMTCWPDAYCLSSGEVFWGGTTTDDPRAELVVEPVTLEELLLTAHNEGKREAYEWRPIETAPRDGTRIWAIVGLGAAENWRRLAGRSFEIRHEGKTVSGFDLGWSLFPGFGGVSDEWFDGWMPLPLAPEHQQGGDR